MTYTKAVMRQALDALENSCDFVFKDISKSYLRGIALDALRKTIAQPEQTAPRGTDAQILKEREITTSAIVGAMAYGFQNGEYPPDDSAWLRPFWTIGRRDAEREALIVQPTVKESLTVQAIAQPEQTATPKAQTEQKPLPNDFRLVPVEMLLDWKAQANQTAACSLKAERYNSGRQLKQQIADVINAAPIAQPEPPTSEWRELNNADRQQVFESLPDMLDGFLKTWGWLHFAKGIEAKCREKNIAQPKDKP